MDNSIKYLRNNIKEIFILFILCSLFAGLNTKWPTHSQLIEYINSIPKIINLMRFLGSYLIPIIFYIYLYRKKKYHFNYNLLLLCLYLYFIMQIIGFANFYFLNDELFMEMSTHNNTIQNGYNLRFSYSLYTSLALIIPLPLIAILLKEELLTYKVIKLSILILLGITMLYTSIVIFQFIYFNKLYFYYVPFLSWGNFFEMPAPRSTGLAKWYLILYLFTMAKYIFSKKSNFVWFLLMALMATFIYMFQSRTSIYFAAGSLIFLFLKKESFIKTILSLFLILSIVYGISEGLVNLKLYSEETKPNKLLISLENKKQNIKNEILNKSIELGIDKDLFDQDQIEDIPLDYLKEKLKELGNNKKLQEKKLQELGNNKSIGIESSLVEVESSLVEVESSIVEVESSIVGIESSIVGIESSITKLQKIEKIKSKVLSENKKDLLTEFKEGRHDNRLLGKPGNYSSGRKDIWIKLSSYIFKNGFNNLIFGYGSQSDRYLAGQNASNGFFYILITSGLIGLFIFLIISFYILFLFLKLLKNFNVLKENKLINHYHFFSIVLLLFLFLRLIIENTFTSYGLDYLFFLICFANVFNLNFKLQNILDKNS